MNFTASQIAALINGKVVGNGEASVKGFGKIEMAQEGELTFFANPKYEDFLYSTKASIIILSDATVLKQNLSATLIRVPDAYSAFAVLLNAYQQMKNQALVGIEQPVYIHPTAKIGDNVYIGAFAYIGENCIIADGVKIYPQTYIGNNVAIDENSIINAGVKLYSETIVGKNVVIHSGTVIGSDGFGYAPQADGSLKKVPQIGNVVIEDGVEIGANATIDRATIGSTIIRTGAKLDNLLQIAHNVEVGSNTVIAAQSGVSGSTKIGKNVMIGGQVGIVGHIQIADGCKINAQSGVSKSMNTPGSAVTGSPAHDYTSALRSQAVNRKLPDLEKRLSALERAIEGLSEENE